MAGAPAARRRQVRQVDGPLVKQDRFEPNGGAASTPMRNEAHGAQLVSAFDAERDLPAPRSPDTTRRLGLAPVLGPPRRDGSQRESTLPATRRGRTWTRNRLEPHAHGHRGFRRHRLGQAVSLVVVPAKEDERLVEELTERYLEIDAEVSQAVVQVRGDCGADVTCGSWGSERNCHTSRIAKEDSRSKRGRPPLTDFARSPTAPGRVQAAECHLRQRCD
jgi:hypothetical protein